MNSILLVVLILLLVGALPMWPYSANWGYYPSGGLGLVLLVLLILALTEGSKHHKRLSHTYERFVRFSG